MILLPRLFCALQSILIRLVAFCSIRNAPFTSLLAAAALCVGLGLPTANAQTAMVAGGGYHSLALKDNGTVVAFGGDAFGQLGQGRAVISAAAVQARGLTNVESMASAMHTVALKTDGTVWAWGKNDFGQVGDGSRVTASTPIQMPGVSGVSMVAAGMNHTLLKKTDGTVWGVGMGGSGQLGYQTVGDSLAPVQAQGMTGANRIAAGFEHSVALNASDGSVWTWGSNKYGQLGRSTSNTCHGAPCGPQPAQVPALSGVIEIAAAWNHTLAVKSDGTVWAWGSNSSGQLGDGTHTDRSSPVQVVGLTGVTFVAAGQSHVLALKSDGTVWAWGDNSAGQLGDGTTTNRLIPVQVLGLTGVMGIGAGGGNSAAGTSSGTAWVWGYNSIGNLGDGTTINRASPVQLQGWTGIQGITFEMVTSVIKSDGTVWSWGFNGYGQLGNGGVASRSIPTAMTALSGVTKIAAGWTHSLVLRYDGTVWESGKQLMTLFSGDDVGSSSPQQVASLAGVTAIAAGDSHNVALKPDGSVWTWGWNGFGQLGDGSTSDRRTPVQVNGLSGVTAIAAGWYQTLALKSDGSVWGWGNNSIGQLGAAALQSCGSSMFSGASDSCITAPMQVAGISSVVALATGFDHSTALKSDGTVWAWGNNESGQLGNGTRTSSSVPQQVSSLSGVTAIAAAWGYNLALKSDGTVWAWGANYAGQLGNGSVIDSSTPVRVQGLTGAAAISAGDTHGLAVKSDGTVWAWGRNDSGNLGDGTYVRHFTAALVTNETVDGVLDLIPAVANSIPSGKLPPFFSAAVLNGSINARPTVVNTTRFNPQDVGKSGAVFVTAMVPQGSLVPLQTTTGLRILSRASAREASSSASFVLIQLTATGWQLVVNGQLIPYASGVLGDLLAAQTILENTDTSTIKGAEFCQGYGTSAEEMTAAGRMKAVVVIPDPDATGAGTVSCIVSSTGASISYNLPASLGWNLLGNSLNQGLSVAALFGDPNKVTTVWKWDTTVTGWQFYAPSMDAAALQAYTAGKGYGLLSVINPGEGYWVNAKAEQSFGSQSGMAFNLTTTNLVQGWNLAATGNEVTPPAFNQSLGATPLTTLWAWDNFSSHWYFYAPSLEANGTLSSYIAGKGYLDFGSKTLGSGTGFWVNRP